MPRSETIFVIRNLWERAYDITLCGLEKGRPYISQVFCASPSPFVLVPCLQKYFGFPSGGANEAASLCPTSTG